MHNTFKILNIPLLAVILFTHNSTAQIKPADVDKIISDEMIRQNLPGLAIGVYQIDEINYMKGYGYIDIDRKKPITTSTPFRWASISKTLTAVAVFQLDERRTNFSVNDKVEKYYPYWTSNIVSANRSLPDKDRKAKVTLEHLLTHESGINHYSRGKKNVLGEYKNKKNSTYITDADNFNANLSVDIFREARLDFDPGSDHLYTTYGYNLLGAVVDEVTGSYTNWVKNNIKNELGLSSLKVSNGNFNGFQKNKDGIINKYTDKTKEQVLPGGGWESNIKDLLRFGRGIAEGRLLQKTGRLWRLNFRKYHGLFNDRDKIGVSHGGKHNNLKTLLYLIPEKEIVVALMIPVQYAKPLNIVNLIINKMGITKSFDESPMDKCGEGMSSSDKNNFVGIWRKTNQDVIIRRGYTSINFKKEWNFLSSKGYHLEDIEFSDNLWNGIFKKGIGGQYAMWRNYDHAGFNKKWKEMNSKGYRLYDLETYEIGGIRKWAGLFKKSTGKYAMWRNYSTKNFAKKREKMAEIGMKLIDLEVYNSGGKLKWSGVWIAGKDGLLNRNYNYNDFKNLVQKRNKNGYKLIDIEKYSINGKEKWAGIWEKSSKLQKVNFKLNYCDIMTKHDNYSNMGYELISLEND